MKFLPQIEVKLCKSWKKFLNLEPPVMDRWRFWVPSWLSLTILKLLSQQIFISNGCIREIPSQRIAEARKELMIVLTNDELRDAILLVFANN